MDKLPEDWTYVRPCYGGSSSSTIIYFLPVNRPTSLCMPTNLFRQLGLDARQKFIEYALNMPYPGVVPSLHAEPAYVVDLVNDSVVRYLNNFTGYAPLNNTLLRYVHAEFDEDGTFIYYTSADKPTRFALIGRNSKTIRDMAIVERISNQHSSVVGVICPRSLDVVIFDLNDVDESMIRSMLEEEPSYQDIQKAKVQAIVNDVSTSSLGEIHDRYVRRAVDILTPKALVSEWDGVVPQYKKGAQFMLAAAILKVAQRKDD